MGVKNNAVLDGLQQKWVTVLVNACLNLIPQKVFAISIYYRVKAARLNSVSWLKITYPHSKELKEYKNVPCFRGSRSFLSRFFNRRNDNKQKPVLDLVDGLLNPRLTAYSRLNESQRLPSTGSCTSRDIQLQCLDARALLSRTATSTPASSLDLEWEHETIPISMIHDPSGSSWTALPEDLSQCISESSPQNTAAAANSDSDWSRVSSTNSLEWDNVQNSIQASSPISEMDTDTQMLLSEIERLTSKTLSETGHDLFS